LLEGNAGHQKLSKTEPKPRPITPDPPDYLGDRGLRRWDELVEELDNTGVLAIVDGDVLGGYCFAYQTFVQANREIKKRGSVIWSASGHASPNPWVAIRNRAIDDMHKWGAELGIGAASRTKIEIKPKQESKSALEQITGANSRR